MNIEREAFERLMRDEQQDTTLRNDMGYEDAATHLAFTAWIQAIQLKEKQWTSNKQS